MNEWSPVHTGRQLWFFYFVKRVMKGCFNASTGVHLFSGFKFKHRSNKSTKRLSSLVSTSSIAVPFALASSNLVLRSRVGLVRLRIRTTSYSFILFSVFTIVKQATSKAWASTIHALRFKTHTTGRRKKRTNLPCLIDGLFLHFESSTNRQSVGLRIGLDGGFCG